MQVRPAATLEEFGDAVGAISHYFGAAGGDLEGMERFARNLPFERMHTAFDDGRVVGGAGAFPFELTVPGGRQVPCAGVTVVGVLPTHRRRGILGELMRTQLEDVRRRGEPLAVLWASEEAIYRRFGYGLAALGGEMGLARGYHGLRVPPLDGVTSRLVSLEKAKELVPPIYDRVRRVTPGMYARTETWWETRLLADPAERREEGAAKNCVVLSLDGRPMAYALYRVISKWEAGHNVGWVSVIEAIGEDGALVELWRYLLGIDWVASFRASALPLDHPLLHALEYPRRAELRLGDVLWARLVDVGAALSARAYASADPVVLEVEDALLPENAGRWRVGDGRCERTDDEPELALDVRELASTYLGGVTFAELVRAGLVRELREGAAFRADGVFRAERKPWCPEIF
jgi:predicted acetyltransferase